MDDKTLQLIINRFAQDVSYKFSDLVLSYPPATRAVVLAVAQSCITADLGSLPKSEKELFEIAKNKMIITTIPPQLDPRKYGGVKDE